MKVKITKIARFNTDKEGKLLKTANGKIYERVFIQCQEYGDRWLSGFGNETNKKWQEGDIVDIEVKEVIGKDGNFYLNFTIPSRLDLLEERIGALEIELKALKNKVFQKND